MSSLAEKERSKLMSSLTEKERIKLMSHLQASTSDVAVCCRTFRLGWKNASSKYNAEQARCDAKGRRL
jgi:hypothetical protein